MRIRDIQRILSEQMENLTLESTEVRNPEKSEHIDAIGKQRLSDELYNMLTEYLQSLPNIGDIDTQRILLSQAGLDNQLLGMIDFGGSPEQFFQKLIITSFKYGMLEDGRYALNALLESTKSVVGKDKQEYCESLIQRLDSTLHSPSQSVDTSDKISKFKIYGIQTTISAIEAIKETGLFQDIVEQITALEEVYLTPRDSLVVESQTHEQFNHFVSQLSERVSIVNQALIEILAEHGEGILSIKLPPVTDITEAGETLIGIDRIFKQLLVNEYVKGEVKLQRFDSGSLWIEILVGGGVALKIIVLLIKAIILLKRESIKNQQLLETVRSHKITNDVREKIGEQLAQHHGQLLKQQIREIIKASGAPEDDHEYQERIKYCLDETTKLVDRGLKMFPATTVPEEIKADFPDFTKPIEEMLPQIKELAGVVTGEQG